MMSNDRAGYEVIMKVVARSFIRQPFGQVVQPAAAGHTIPLAVPVEVERGRGVAALAPELRGRFLDADRVRHMVVRARPHLRRAG